MKRLLIITVLLAFAGGQSVSAQIVGLLHDGEPVISVVYPDGWQIKTPSKDGGNLISAMPADGSMLWQGIWLVRDAFSIAQAFNRLDAIENNLFTDVKQTKAPWQQQIGELTVHCREGEGVYKDTEPIELFIALFKISEQRIGALAYMGKPEAIKQHQADLDYLLRSLVVEK
jgi:hypothetical protein